MFAKISFFRTFVCIFIFGCDRNLDTILWGNVSFLLFSLLLDIFSEDGTNTFLIEMDYMDYLRK